MANVKTPLSYYLRQKIEFVCLDCSLSICAETDGGCLYRLAQPDNRIAGQKAFIEKAKLRSAIAKLGFKKYDKRRKGDTPQRMLWRVYKQKQINA